MFNKRENESSNCTTTGEYYSNRVRITLTRTPNCVIVVIVRYRMMCLKLKYFCDTNLFQRISLKKPMWRYKLSRNRRDIFSACLVLSDYCFRVHSPHILSDRKETLEWLPQKQQM